jgi:uncharacterized OsmC-like protein
MVSEKSMLEVELRWKGKLKIESSVRDFGSILMDDKKKGDDSAPTPVEMFLSSIGSCAAMSFIYCISLSKVDVHPESLKFKVSGRVGRLEERLRLLEVKMEFLVKSGSDNAKIQKCFEKFQPFCILSESIQPTIQFSCDLKIVE